MNTNEECLIKYLSKGKYEQREVTDSIIGILLKYNKKFSFEGLNSVGNIIDELEFFDNLLYN